MKAHIVKEQMNKWNGKKSIRQFSIYVIVDATDCQNLLEAPMYYYSMADRIFFPAVGDDCYITAINEGCGVVADFRTSSGEIRREIFNSESLLPFEKAFLLGL